MNKIFSINVALQLLLFLGLTRSSLATSFDLRFRYLESAKYSEGQITFDPYISEDGVPPKFKVAYGFRFKGRVDEGELQGLSYEFGRGESDLLEVICQLKNLKDGNSIKKINLIDIKRNGPNLVGVIFRERDGIFTPFKFELSFESAVAFSEKVTNQCEWLRSKFGAPALK